VGGAGEEGARVGGREGDAEVSRECLRREAVRGEGFLAAGVPRVTPAEGGPPTSAPRWEDQPQRGNPRGNPRSREGFLAAGVTQFTPAEGGPPTSPPR
jgi:hypothetical protein